MAIAFVLSKLATKHSSPAGHTGRTALSSQLHLGLPDALRTAASTAIGSSTPAYRLRAQNGAFTARGAGGTSIRFSRSDAQIASGGMRVGLSLKALGYGSSLQPVGANTTLAGNSNRATYSYKQLSEWFSNGPLGLEQGFTLKHAPRRAAVGPLTLSLAVSGNAYATHDPRGTNLLFARPHHRPAMRYGSLSAIDASGHRLRTSLQIHGTHEIRLRVDTRGARYPILIDPLLQQRETLNPTSELNSLFGNSVAVSADGNTALIGVPGDNNDLGAAYVFARSGSTWVQQGAKLTASDAKGMSFFGNSVALSADGNTALIGGQGSGGVGLNSEGKTGGGVWAFTRSGSVWTQQGGRMLPAHSNEPSGFGWHVALSADGNTALVGIFPGTGTWVFTRSGSTWSQQAELSAPEQVSEASAGRSIALSADGNTALIGGPIDTRGIGAVWAFARSGSTWSQQGKKLTGSEQEESGPAWGSEFGTSIALSADGNVAIIGGWADSDYKGAIWMFTRSGSTWTQEGRKITPGGGIGVGLFGGSVALTPDGNVALVGGFEDNSDLGAAWVFTRTGNTFVQEGEKLTANDEAGEALFGYSVALSADGNTALIGGMDNNEGRGAAWVFQAPPATTTGTASAIGQTSATLNAQVYPASRSVSDCHFEYGPSTAYGSSQPCSSLPGIEDRPVEVTTRVAGLLASTTYHFRIVATIAGVTSDGNDATFTTATPMLPEFGTCIKRALADGRYKTPNCTTPSIGENSGRYEWEPWPAVNDRFSASGAATTLETTGGATVQCTASRDEGEYSSSQSLTISAVFTGCRVAGLFGGECRSENAHPGEVVSALLEARLGVIKGGSNPSIGWEMQPVSGSLIASFICGETKLSMTGSAIGRVTPDDKMTSSLSLQYTASKGKQTPEAFEGGGNKILALSSANTAEHAGLTATYAVANEEPIEIRDTP